MKKRLGKRKEETEEKETYKSAGELRELFGGRGLGKGEERKNRKE